MGELEYELVTLLGEGQLKNIGEQIAEIVRQHNLQKSPDVCRMLFTYIISVIDGWNFSIRRRRWKTILKSKRRPSWARS